MWRENRKGPQFGCVAPLLAALLSISSHAAEVLVIASAGHDHYRRAAAALAQSTTLSSEIRFAPDVAPVPASVQVVVGLGVDAVTRIAAHRPNQPYIAALISAGSYRTLRATVDGADGPAAVLLLDQPLGRQLEIARHLLPDMRRIGVLLTAASAVVLPRITGIEVVTRLVPDQSNVVLELETLLRETDGLLAVPDKRLFNRNTLHGVLLSAYRLGKPVIGYSKPLVKAGALFTAYSTPEQLGAQAGAMVGEVLAADEAATEVAYPREFRIKVNHGIGRALGLPPLDPAVETRDYRHAGELP